MNNSYDDIINLPHHVSKKHPQMSLKDRTAQFAPFAALSGHGESINETARLTEEKIDLDDEIKLEIANKINYIINNLNLFPNVTITFFVKDSNKSGGKYETKTVSIKKFDETSNSLILKNNSSIKIDDILTID